MHTVAQRIARADSFAEQHQLILTPLRRQVYEQIVCAKRPIGAYELLIALEPQRGRLPPTTVYRVLEFLVEHGFVHRIESRNAFIACCEMGKPHHSQFLICDQCGNTVEIPGGPATKRLTARSETHGFEIHKQVVELCGLCGPCKNRLHTKASRKKAVSRQK